MCGRIHRRSSVLVGVLAFIVMMILCQHLALSAFVSISIVIAEYYFSPDLDTRCRAIRSWGLFGWIWKPYQKAFPHRSFFTHSPIVGTFIRLAYLSPIWIPLVFLTNGWYLFGIFAICLEFSANIHYLLDKVPSRF